MSLREKVKAKLIKNGNNVNDVENMMKECFDYASSKYSTVSQIAIVIRTIY